MKEIIFEAAIKSLITSDESAYLKSRARDATERLVERTLMSYDRMVGKRPLPKRPKFYHRPARKNRELRLITTQPDPLAA